jgi:hypothetical protein
MMPVAAVAATREVSILFASIISVFLLNERFSTRRVFAAEPEKYAGMAETAESPEFSGRVIDALARDHALMSRSGKVWIGAELGLHYGVTDTDGRQPVSPRAFFGDTTHFGDAVVE